MSLSEVVKSLKNADSARFPRSTLVTSTKENVLVKLLVVIVLQYDVSLTRHSEEY